jgi:hypothetical protein
MDEVSELGEKDRNNIITIKCMKISAKKSQYVRTDYAFIILSEEMI